MSQQRKVATVVAGVDLRTGEVFVGVKKSTDYGRLAVCAEDITFRGLGANYIKIKQFLEKIEFQLAKVCTLKICE